MIYQLPADWSYYYRQRDSRYVLYERGDYRGDFPTMKLMFEWLKERGEL